MDPKLMKLEPKQPENFTDPMVRIEYYTLRIEWSQAVEKTATMQGKMACKKDISYSEAMIRFAMNTTYADFQSIVNHWKEKHPEENVVVCYIVGDDTL